MGFIKDAFGSGLGMVSDLLGGGDAGKASIQAANIQAKSEKAALKYMKEREAIPQQFREGALKQLGGLYGLEGGEGDQLGFIDQARQSPLYEAILGGREQGEEAIARNMAMTGKLRSGNIKSAFYDYNTQLSNRALLESYNQRLGGLQGLAQLPSNVNAIAGGIAGVGRTQAQGITDAAQAEQDARQQGIGNLAGIAKLGLQAYGVFTASDIRLKENIHHIGQKNGHSWFSWDWKDEAKELGLKGSSEGVMAHLVYEYMPEAVGTVDGFVFVNQDMLMKEAV
jgi:hypothetical protein